MKYHLTILFLCMFILPGFAQELSYEIRGNYTRSVKQTTLVNARLLRDFIPGFPINWIAEYVSVDILGTRNSKTLIAGGKNEKLNTEQMNLLNSAVLASDIVINVNYIDVNSVTGIKVNREINVRMTVVPENEAEFIGGYEQLNRYLKSSIITTIDEVTSEILKEGKITFTVSETGEIINTRLSASTGDSKIDKLIISTISSMPKWKPAVNSKGIKVAQEFQFNIGNRGC